MKITGLKNILPVSVGIVGGNNITISTSCFKSFISFPATAAILNMLVYEVQTTPNSLISDDNFKQSWLSRLIVFNVSSILTATSNLYATNPYVFV